MLHGREYVAVREIFSADVWDSWLNYLLEQRRRHICCGYGGDAFNLNGHALLSVAPHDVSFDVLEVTPDDAHAVPFSVVGCSRVNPDGLIAHDVECRDEPFHLLGGNGHDLVCDGIDVGGEILAETLMLFQVVDDVKNLFMGGINETEVGDGRNEFPVNVSFAVAHGIEVSDVASVKHSVQFFGFSEHASDDKPLFFHFVPFVVRDKVSRHPESVSRRSEAVINLPLVEAFVPSRFMRVKSDPHMARFFISLSKSGK